MRAELILAATVFVALSAGDTRGQGATGNPDGPAPVTERAKSPEMVLYDLPVRKPETQPAAASQPGKEAQPPENQPKVTSAPEPMVIPAPSGEVVYGTVNTGNARYDELVKSAAARYGVDPHLIVAVMRQESGFNSRARSHKGATGLMQLMPATARRFGVTNIYDPAQNIDAGVRYLRLLLDMFNGDVSLALAGYNAGENAVINSGYKIPRYRETQHYVKAITARYGRSRHAMTAGPAANNGTPVAPSAIAIPSGSSSRLSNNY